MEPNLFATAYALTTTIGLRPFLTLTLASLAMHFGYLHPAPAFAALGTNGATWLLAGLAALEFAGDKIPVIDHALHVVHFATKPIAAAVLVGAAVPAGTPDATGYTLMALGAANALGIHTGVTALRGASTALTMGTANPFVSLIEDIIAVAGVALAFVLPVAAGIAALVLTLALIVIARRVIVAVRRRRAVAAA